MSTLRELFVSIAIKGDAAKKIEQVDDAADDAAKSMGKLDKAADGVKSTLAGVGKAVAVGTAAIAAGTAAVLGLTTSFAAHGAEATVLAQRLALSTDALQEWQYVASLSGGQAEAVAESFKELEKRTAEAASTGAGPAFEALQRLGIELKSFRNLNADQKMLAIAEATSQLSDEGDKLFAKDALFGEAGITGMGTALDGGTEAIMRLRKEAHALGVVIDKDALKSANEFNDQIVRMKLFITGLKNTIASSLLPIVKDIAKRIEEWAKANRELIVAKAQEWLRKFIEYAEKLVPIIVQLIDKTIQFIDKLGGIDNALKAAAGGWAAFKLAGLAAMGELGLALAAFAVTMAATVKLVDKITNVEGATANNNAAKRANSIADRLRGFVGDPEAKGLFALFAEQSRLVADEDLSVGKAGSINAISDIIDAELNRLEGTGEQAGTPTATPGKRLRKISAGGEKPITLESLLSDERKAGRDQDRLRAIRDQAEALRVNSEGADRMMIDRVLGNINQKLGAGAYKNINELLAEAVGQDTGLAGAQLKPAGLGTTINNIDASITFNVGGIDVEMPASIANSSSPQMAGQTAGESILGELRGWVEKAFRDQRGQIIG